MITVACFLWNDPLDRCAGVYQYSAQDVILLRNQVVRNLTLPHEFVCVTDLNVDLPGIRRVALDRSRFPPGSRYPKLMLFHEDAKETIGETILTLDLDTVVVGNLDEIAGRSEDLLVLWRNPNFGIARRAFYNTSMMLHRAGTRTEIFHRFDPRETPGMLAEKWGGTDQAWVSHICSREEAYWDASHGVYGAGRLRDYNPELCHTVLPDNARIVFFPGRRHPGMAEVIAKHPWIKDHRR